MKVFELPELTRNECEDVLHSYRNTTIDYNADCDAMKAEINALIHKYAAAAGVADQTERPERPADAPCVGRSGDVDVVYFPRHPEQFLFVCQKNGGVGLWKNTLPANAIWYDPLPAPPKRTPADAVKFLRDNGRDDLAAVVEGMK